MSRSCSRQRSRSRGRGPDNSAVGGGKRGSLGDKATTLWTGGLPRDVDEELLRRAFSRFGKLGEIRLKMGTGY